MSTDLISTVDVPCATPAHENFAQALAIHGNRSAAYRHAYPDSTESSGSVRNRASTIARHPEVVRRVRELGQQRKEQLLRDSADLEALVANLCHGKPAQLVDDEGNPIPLHLLPVEVQAAVKGLKLSVTRDMEGRTFSEYEVTFPDPLQALKLLAQLRGALTERHAVHVVATATGLSADDDARIDALLRGRHLPVIEGELVHHSETPPDDGADLV